MSNQTEKSHKKRRKKPAEPYLYTPPQKLAQPTDRSALTSGNRYARFLRQHPNNVRDAFVLAEILGKPLSLRNNYDNE